MKSGAEGSDVCAQAKAPLPIAPKPCNNCRHSAKCQADNLACSAFVLFKRVSKSPLRWGSAPRQPSRALFEQAMTPVKAKSSPVYRRPLDDSEESDES